MADQIIDYDALERATSGSPSRLRKAAKAFKTMAEVLEDQAGDLEGKQATKGTPAGSSSSKQGPVDGRRGGAQRSPASKRGRASSGQLRPEPSGDGRDALGRRLTVDQGDEAASKGRDGFRRDALGRRIQ